MSEEKAHNPKHVKDHVVTEVQDSDADLLNELGYKSEFKREFSVRFSLIHEGEVYN